MKNIETVVRYIITPGSLDDLLIRKDIEGLVELLKAKKLAFADATKNVKFWVEKGMPGHDFCLNEKSRVETLSRQISKIESVFKEIKSSYETCGIS